MLSELLYKENVWFSLWCIYLSSDNYDSGNWHFIAGNSISRRINHGKLLLNFNLLELKRHWNPDFLAYGTRPMKNEAINVFNNQLKKFSWHVSD